MLLSRHDEPGAVEKRSDSSLFGRFGETGLQGSALFPGHRLGPSHHGVHSQHKQPRDE